MARSRHVWGLFLLMWWPAAAKAQQLGGGGATVDVSIVRIFAALLLCLAAAFGLALVIRARKGGVLARRMGWFSGAMAGSRRIKIVETRRATPFADICLVQCDGDEYLLLCGPSGQTILRSPDGPGREAEERSDVA